MKGTGQGLEPRIMTGFLRVNYLFANCEGRSYHFQDFPAIYFITK